MKPNYKEMKLMRSKFYGNLAKGLDYKPINYDALDPPYGLSNQSTRRL